LLDSILKNSRNDACYERYEDEIRRCYEAKWQVAHPDYTRACKLTVGSRKSAQAVTSMSFMPSKQDWRMRLMKRHAENSISRSPRHISCWSGTANLSVSTRCSSISLPTNHRR